MSEKRQNPLFGVGGMTLLTVLLVLVLTMFAVLTVSSAQADMRLSEKNARAVSDYYAADHAAVRLQAKAADMWPLDQPKPNVSVMLKELAADYDLRVNDWDDGLMFSCDIPITATGQILQLTLFLAPPGSAARWRIEQWQFIPPATELFDEPVLPVFLPEFEDE